MEYNEELYINANHYDFGITFTFNSNYAITIIIAILRFFIVHCVCHRLWTCDIGIYWM